MDFQHLVKNIKESDIRVIIALLATVLFTCSTNWPILLACGLIIFLSVLIEVIHSQINKEEFADKYITNIQYTLYGVSIGGIASLVVLDVI